MSILGPGLWRFKWLLLNKCRDGVGVANGMILPPYFFTSVHRWPVSCIMRLSMSSLANAICFHGKGGWIGQFSTAPRANTGVSLSIKAYVYLGTYRHIISASLRLEDGDMMNTSSSPSYTTRLLSSHAAYTLPHLSTTTLSRKIQSRETAHSHNTYISPFWEKPHSVKIANCLLKKPRRANMVWKGKLLGVQLMVYIDGCVVDGIWDATGWT